MYFAPRPTNTGKMNFSCREIYENEIYRLRIAAICGKGTVDLDEIWQGVV